MTLTAVLQRLWLWVLGTNPNEVESEEGNRPETVTFRQRRSALIAERHEADRKAGVRRPKPYDPYKPKEQRARIRLVVVGGPFFEPVPTSGYSMEKYPYRTSARQLVTAIQIAAIQVDRNLTIHEQAVAARKVERDRLRRERVFEEAVKKEQVSVERKETP